jgi:hypothetical protein
MSTKRGRPIVKIRKVTFNNRRRVFEVLTHRGTLCFPYAKTEIKPSSADKIAEIYVDRELGREAFTYVLESGAEGTVHVDWVLEYNRDPAYMKDVMLYKLTLEAQDRVERSPLSKRELIRRLGTSATQFYRLLDQTNYRKSMSQLLSLLHILDCDVEFVVKDRPRKSA